MQILNIRVGFQAFIFIIFFVDINVRFMPFNLNFNHMKKLLLSVLLLFVLSSVKSQSATIDTLPIKDTLIFYEKVFTLSDKINKDAVFNSVVEWCASEFKNSNDVIKLSDRVNGEIVGNGQVIVKGWLSNYSVRFTFRVDIKDQKYRIQINNFLRKDYDNPYSTDYHAVEKYYFMSLGKKGLKYKQDVKFFSALNESTNELINSLVDFVNKTKTNNF